jgi:hypothetical protein
MNKPGGITAAILLRHADDYFAEVPGTETPRPA